jgi:hypothetical protein
MSEWYLDKAERVCSILSSNKAYRRMTMIVAGARCFRPLCLPSAMSS